MVPGGTRGPDAIVAVSVTGSPKVDGLGDAASVNDVGSCVTVRSAVATTDPRRSTALPGYLAITPPGYTPGGRSSGTFAAATPFPSVLAIAIAGLLASWNSIRSPGTGAPFAESVAVSVTLLRVGAVTGLTVKVDDVAIEKVV